MLNLKMFFLISSDGINFELIPSDKLNFSFFKEHTMVEHRMG